MKYHDLNLLMHFDALIVCRSVSGAAALLGITQPAMSAALSRLRKIFNDPILMRENGGLKVTERALELHQTFMPLLEQWRIATSSEADFDPRTSRRVFTLYGTDYIQFTLLPKLAKSLEKDAPGIQLRILPAKLYHGLSMLDSNYVEFVIGYYPDPSADLRTRFLFEDKLVCLVRNGHPCLRKSWNVENYLTYSHVDLAAHTRNFGQLLDRNLQQINRRRQIAMTVSSYLATPYIVASSDLIAAIPLSIAEQFSKHLNVMQLELPFSLLPYRISLYWHERYQTDYAHGWLRQYIGQQFGEVA